MGKCIVVVKLTAEAEEVNLERRGRKAGSSLRSEGEEEVGHSSWVILRLKKITGKPRNCNKETQERQRGKDICAAYQC